MTQLSSRGGERRSDMVTGQHIRLAMLAAGVEDGHVDDIAESAGVFRTDIMNAWVPLREAGLVAFDHRFHDQLTPEGQQFVAEETDAMRAAHELVAGFAVQI